MPVPPGDQKDLSALIKSTYKPPKFFNSLAKYLMRIRFSPFDFQRLLGVSQTHNYMGKFFAPRIYSDCSPEEQECIRDYLHQNFIRVDTSERCITVMFDADLDNLLQAKIPLSGPDKLGNPNFQLPFSIIFADDDFVNAFDNGASEQLIKDKKELCQ